MSLRLHKLVNSIPHITQQYESLTRLHIQFDLKKICFVGKKWMNSWRMMAYVEWLNNISSWSRRGRSNSCRHGESYSRVGILHNFATIQLHTLWCQIVPAWVFIRNSLSLPTIVFMEGKLNFFNTGLDMNFIWRIPFPSYSLGVLK